MKKKYGLLFLLCLLMFFCINIDGVAARPDEGGGGSATKNDGPKSCLYTGTLPGYSVDTTSSAASIAITYDCRSTNSPKCKADYHAVVHSGSSSGKTSKITINNSNKLASEDSMQYFYDDTFGIRCRPYIYIQMITNGVDQQVEYYNFYYFQVRGSVVFSNKSFSGDVNDAADKAAEEGGSTGRSDGTKNQDMTDDIRERAKNEKEKQGDSGIDTSQLSCSEVLGDKFTDFLKSVFLLISIGGIILLIILASLDFIKVITSSEDNAMSEAFKKVRNRVIAVIILLLLPLLVNFLTDIINNNLHMEDGKVTVGSISDCNVVK